MDSERERTSKAALRRTVLAARRTRDGARRDEIGSLLAAHAAAEPVLARARRAAVYLAMPDEPPTDAIIDSLPGDVLVPLTRPEGRLDWVAHDPSAPLRRSALGVPEPEGEPLPGDPLAEADVVYLPALAVDLHGVRLGRGAGYYDRALAALDDAPRRPLTCAVVFSDELVAHVPAEPHDRPVDLVLTEAGLFRPSP
ncbi:MAG: 5-formyltetrahydrofolate cyclo-ligase [Aeromicrobium sp.]|uniref:5-formyltetrahydrofolate cyclo-ligase n=1 Tax=Aeromicrobium sp. TaxID=1871063 RepID=UPI0039E2AB1F